MKKVKIVCLVLIIAALTTACTSKISNEGKSNNQPLNTTINGEKLSSNSYEELDNLPKKYTPEMAQKNGDIVGVHGKVYNIEKLDEFIKKYKEKKVSATDMVRITSYTIEGDAVVYDLIISGKDIKLIFDNRRDEWSAPEHRKKFQYNIVDIFTESKDEGVEYKARNDKDEEILLLYVNNKNVDESYDYLNEKLYGYDSIRGLLELTEEQKISYAGKFIHRDEVSNKSILTIALVYNSAQNIEQEELLKRIENVNNKGVIKIIDAKFSYSELENSMKVLSENMDLLSKKGLVSVALSDEENRLIVTAKEINDEIKTELGKFVDMKMVALEKGSGDIKFD